MTLLEEAKKLNNKYIGLASNEETELALAWLKQEVSSAAVAKVVNVRQSSVASRMAVLLRKAYAQGLITAKDVV